MARGTTLWRWVSEGARATTDATPFNAKDVGRWRGTFVTLWCLLARIDGKAMRSLQGDQQ